MCKSNKIVNVFLNSNNALSGSVNNDATYNIDWSAILKPNKAYRLHWSYVGMPNSFNTTTKLAQVQIDFQMNQYLNSSSTYGAPTTYTIGVLRSFYLNGTINYLFADDNNNPPIYLQTRPYSNTFKVRVLTTDATPVVWTDSAAAVNNNYVLTLSFEEMEHEHSE
jgi:hypothetical protein